MLTANQMEQPFSQFFLQSQLKKQNNNYTRRNFYENLKKIFSFPGMSAIYLFYSCHGKRKTAAKENHTKSPGNPAVRGRDKKIKRRKGNPQASFCKSRMEI